MYEPLLIPDSRELPISDDESFFSANKAIETSPVEKTVEEFIAKLEPGKASPFATQGRITSAKLLKMILDSTGPADVFITSWSITQDAVQQLINLKIAGNIRSIKIVLDSRAPKHWPDAFQLLSMNVEHLRLAKCQAKLIAVRSEKVSVAIISSLNWSAHHSRFEAGYIDTTQQHVDFVIAEIENLYTKAKPWN